MGAGEGAAEVWGMPLPKDALIWGSVAFEICGGSSGGSSFEGLFFLPRRESLRLVGSGSVGAAVGGRRELVDSRLFERRRKEKLPRRGLAGSGSLTAGATCAACASTVGWAILLFTMRCRL